MSDWMMGLGGLISGVGSVGSAVFNALSQKETNRQNLKLQKETWAREDSAVQRRSADLAKAGINPLLAAGQAAQAGPAVRMEAPRVDTKAASGLGDALMDIVRGNVAISQTQAQTELIRAQAQNAGTTGALLEIQRKVASETADADIAKARSVSASAGYQANLDKFNSFIETAINGGSGIIAGLPGVKADQAMQFGSSLMYAKKMLDSYSSLNELERNVLALQTSGMLQKVTEQFVSMNPGYAQGIQEYLKALGLVSGGSAGVRSLGELIPK